MQEAQPDELVTAWLELPEDQRNLMAAEFREIFEMSCERGVWPILDEARWQWRDDPERLTAFVERLSAAPNHYHRAIITRNAGEAPSDSTMPMRCPIGASASTWATA